MLLITSTGPMLCRQNIFKSSWHFSPDFLTQYKPQQVSPHESSLFNSTSDALPIQLTKDTSIFSYENAQRAINIATIIFATIKIYERYQTIGATARPTTNDYQLISAIKKIIASLCPDMLQSMGAYGFFLIDSTTIVFKALVYKTIARLLLLCAHGDLSDLIGSIAHGGIHTAKLLL